MGDYCDNNYALNEYSEAAADWVAVRAGYFATITDAWNWGRIWGVPDREYQVVDKEETVYLTFKGKT